MNLNQLTIKEAREGLKKKEFSSVDLTKSCLEQIKKLQPRLNAFITICEDEAIKQARHADKRLNNETIEQFPLLGIPVALKDLFSTKDIKTTAGSKVLENYIPPFNATVVDKLLSAGAVIMGKANCDAWAHGSSGENSDFGPTKNPWNEEYVPGGSSSGSAVSVASSMCLASTGTDTGGSIRLPASFCNIVGLKPTYGRVSRYGIVAMASSFDSIGHFTKTVEDSALMLNVTAGKDILDGTTSSKPVTDYTGKLLNRVKKLKIGMPRKLLDGVDNEIKKLMLDAENVLKSLGAEIVDIDFKYSEYAIACYYIIQPSEVSSNLARYDGIRYGNERSSFGAEAKRRIMLGTFTLSAGYYDAYYKKAMQVRTLIKNEYEEKFKSIDAIISPTSPTLPWKFGEKVNDPLKMYLSDIFTVTANLAGIPGLSIPIGFSSDPSARASTELSRMPSGQALPVGMQILGSQFSEEKLFQIGHAYEQATNWHKMKPKLI